MRESHRGPVASVDVRLPHSIACQFITDFLLFYEDTGEVQNDLGRLIDLLFKFYEDTGEVQHDLGR